MLNCESTGLAGGVIEGVRGIGEIAGGVSGGVSGGVPGGVLGMPDTISRKYSRRNRNNRCHPCRISIQPRFRPEFFKMHETVM